MKRGLSLILLLSLILSLCACAFEVYKLPHDEFCYSAVDGSIIELEPYEKEFIIGLLNNGIWHFGLAKCPADVKFYTQNQDIGYCAEEGLFNDFTLNRSLILSEEERVTLNSYLGIYDGFYKVSVTGSKDSLMESLRPTYEAGTLVEIKAYPVTDVSLHVFVNGEEIPMSHWDSDYWGFEFIMPAEDITVHLTYDQFYGRTEYSFDELCWWLNRLDRGVFKVCTKTTDYSKKYSLIENRYSFKEEDIENFKAIFEQELIKVDDSEASNSNFGYEYVFYYDEEQYSSINFGDEYYHWNDFSSWQAFKFKDESYVLPTIENPDFITYSFQYDGRSSDVKRNDDESFLMRYTMIDSVEFIPYEGDSFVSDSPFYLDSGYGKINLLSPTIFELNGEYYEIISGVEYWAYNYCKLSELISACPYEWVGGSEGHYKHMLCDCCDDLDVIYSHENRDADMFCDICGYFSEFTDSGLVLEDYQTWLADLNSENVYKITVNHTGSNVWEGMFCERRVTENKYLIDELIAQYKSVKLYNINVALEITDELYHVEFLLTDGTKQDLYFNGGAFIGRYMASDFPTLEKYEDVKTTLSFNLYKSKGYVYESYSTVTPISNFADWDLRSIEFEIYDSNISGVEPTHCIKFNYWEIYIVDNTLFYVRNRYLDEVPCFKLTNADFYELIENNPIK